MQTAKCRGCGAEIVWAVSELGRKIPLDIEGTRGFRLIPGGSRNLEQPEAVSTVIFQSHFATCPKADQFRGKGGQS
jgi:hypothetical protein